MNKKLSVKDRAMLAMQTPAPVTDLPSISDPAQFVKVKTGPGAFVAHLAKESEVFNENLTLKNELKGWSDASPAKKLDPSLVYPSKWANRHRDSFTSVEFQELKADIQSSSGNVQAIKVRPIPGSDPQRYEIVYGHRRHRACLELGLPVFAVIESIDEHALFVEMDRENRQRADLRPYEQGEMYRLALDDGLYVSLRKLCEEVGVQASNASVAIKIARLPSFVLDAFPSRLDIQFRWATPLANALEKDPDAVLARAKVISSEKPDKARSAIQVFKALIGEVNQDSKKPLREVKVDGKTVLIIKTSDTKVVFEIGLLSEEKIAKVQKTILDILAD